MVSGKHSILIAQDCWAGLHGAGCCCSLTPEDRFSCVKAHIILFTSYCLSLDSREVTKLLFVLLLKSNFINSKVSELEVLFGIIKSLNYQKFELSIVQIIGR